MSSAHDLLSSGEASSKALWTPSEYVLYGRYCDPEAISSVLETLRAKSGAETALLMVNREQTLFHSLLLIAHRDAAVGATLRDRLRTRPRPRRPGWQRLPLVGYDDAASLAAALVEHPPFEQLEEVLRHERLTVMCREGRPSPTDAVAPPASVHVLLTGSTDPVPEQRVDSELERLLLMVNASAPVVVHGSLHVQRLADRQLDAVARSIAPVSEEAGTDVDDPAALREIAQALLNEALDLTNSSLGNIYLADRDGEHLRLVAHCRNIRVRESIRMDEVDSVVAWVYDRRRPLVINDIADFQRLHPSAGPLDVSDEEHPPYAELTVPILQHSLSAGGSTLLGVVNVEKLQGVDEGRFTYRDLTLLHSVATRLALWRAHAMLRYTAGSLAGLTRRNAAPADLSAAEPGLGDLDPRVPADAVLAQEVIDETLQRIYSLTRSHSATVRLLSPDRRWLMRFSAYPVERLDDPGPAIGIDESASLVAWVARHGKACHISNMKERTQLRAYPGLTGPLSLRDGTLSELCLPIFVSGRLVGVLNLESRFRDGYVDSIETATAVAEQVGLALQYARRVQEQTVLSMSTASTASVHELAKTVDRLDALVETHAADAGLAEALRGISAEVAKCIRSGADLADEPGGALSALVRDVLSDLGLDDVVRFRGTPQADLQLRAGDALSLRVALTALFDNANSNMHNHRLRLEARWSTHTVGGRDYLTLYIGNSIGLDRPEHVLRSLFRRPVRHREGGRLHLGAFTAAALVRSLGGDVFVRIAGTPDFVVGVDLPVDLDIAQREEAA